MYHPYKVCLVHELSEEDFDRRNQFCEQMQELCTNDNNFVKIVIFSDVATFILNAHANRQNCRYWATENIRWMIEQWRLTCIVITSKVKWVLCVVFKIWLTEISPTATEMEYHTQRPKKMNVWCGIVDGRILGPYFFDVNLTEQNDTKEPLMLDIDDQRVTLKTTMSGKKMKA
ncbi:hypothetical protein NQ318_004473 [Aromia moschata]|uniref:Uncharacterized protein n=1 Tax=Aromia moschata TaxID=1265417 RepID=A0AAV8YAR3_9CUCU|nr:hypothetical protein NQ318_004473 [Aromia moschata]